MNRSRKFPLVVLFIWLGLLGSALVGCTDVGDNTGGGEDAGDAGGIDATATDGEEPETGSDATGGPLDGQPSAEGGQGGADGASDAGVDATIDAGLGSGMDTGVGPGVDTGAGPGMDAGTDTGTGPGMDAGTDTGAGPRMDAGTDTGAGPGMDSGTDTGVGPGMDAGVDTGTGPGMEAGVDAGPCVAECPASNPNCMFGGTQGIGYPGCNQTEALLNAHVPSVPDNGTGLTCLQCALNFGCLHDTSGGDQPPNVYDCEDVPSGSDTFGGGNETNLEACLDVLRCELPSNCGTNNTLYCYCGEGVDSTTCKTSQIGACVSQVQFGLESTDPNFIQANFSSIGTLLPAALADKVLLCARNNCIAECF